MCRAHSNQGVRGAEARDAPTAANVSSGATIGRARLNPSGLTPGRLFGEQGSILCSQSRIRGTGILQVSRHETLEKARNCVNYRPNNRAKGRPWTGKSAPYAQIARSDLAPMWQTPDRAYFLHSPKVRTRRSHRRSNARLRSARTRLRSCVRSQT